MDFHKLLLLTLDIEGALRVLLASDSPEARESLAAKIAAFNSAIDATPPASPEPSETPEISEIPEPSETPEIPESPAKPVDAFLPREAFTLNDRYRFVAELFNADAADFDDTVRLLASMPDMKEAEDFLYRDLLWDPADPVVQEFIDILRQYLPH